MSDQPKDIGELLKPVYDLQDRRTAEAVERRFKREAWDRAVEIARSTGAVTSVASISLNDLEQVLQIDWEAGE